MDLATNGRLASLAASRPEASLRSLPPWNKIVGLRPFFISYHPWAVDSIQHSWDNSSL